MKRNRGRSNKDGFEMWGGYMNAKKSKLEQQFVSVAGEDGIQISNIFKDIAIFVNGLTEPSADELRFLMMKHGGLYHHYYSTERTTHVIASNLPYSKMKLLKSMKVVKPQWIVDSIEANKVLDYRDYLLYTSESRTQPKLPFKTNFTMESNSNVGVNDSAKKSPDKQRWIARNASDSNFLSEFYNNSRLHLISTMGATFKEYINKLRSSGKNVYPGLETLKAHVNERLSRSTDDCTVENCKNVIMHIDMDCFFVSVGVRNRHHLMGKPVAVTHARGNNAHPREGADPTLERKLYAKKYEEKTGTEMRKDHWSKSLNETDSMAEIASCSYEARKYGIKNGMFLGQALKLCPDLKTIPYDFEDYKEVAFVLYDTVAKYTLNIEAVSCDEMFVDCSEILSATSATVTEFASILRREIKEKTGCPCSTGFGNNRLQARLATKKAKPDGQFYLKPENVSDFMNNIDISDLPGVGSSTSHKLHSMGIRTCGKLQALPLHKLQSEFGNKLGETLYKNSRGIDEKKLVFTNVRKSVSAEVNYGIRFQNDTDRDKFLKQLSEEVSSRLAEVKMKGKCITLKIMVRSKEAPEETAKYMGHGLCDYITKSCTLSSPVFEANSIFREVLTIINNLNVKAKELRGIGIQISRLENNAVSNNLKKFFDQNDKKTLVSKVTKTFDNANNREKELINMPSTSKACTLQSDINLADVSISQVDPSFLQALPKTLQHEILSSLKFKKKTELEKKIMPAQTVVISNENRIGNKDLCHLKTTQSKEERKNDNASYVSPDEMRIMLKEWVKSEEIPNTCDIEMFGDYLRQMVTSHQIDHLQVLLKSFYWCVMREHKSSIWKDAYTTVTERIQVSMITEYGGRLMIKEKFKNIIETIA